MGELVSAFLAFPAVVWSILLVLVAVYWMFVFLGALDIELFDLDGDADVDLDADAPGVDAVHPHVDADADAGGGHGFGTILASLGLSGVPLMVSMSFLVLYAWGLAMAGVMSLPWIGVGGVLGWLAGIALLAASFMVALPLAALSVKPLRHVFKTHKAVRRHALVGRTCRVTTQEVTGAFGQAEIDERGATYLVQVRCARDNSFAKDSQAIIYDYDPGDEVFHIAPIDEVKQTA